MDAKAVPAWVAGVALLLAMHCGGEMDRAVRTQTVELSAPVLRSRTSIEEALSARRSVRDYAAGSLELAQLAQLLWAAQGITSEDGLRTAPSAGALYPLELHVVAGEVEGLAPAVYRYVPGSHQLAPHQAGDVRAALAAAALDQECVAQAPAVLAIAAVHRRTSAKYGERAGRYVDMEVGCAAENVYLQCVSLELGTVLVGAFDDERVQRVLGLPRGERPLALMPIGRRVE